MLDRRTLIFSSGLLLLGGCKTPNDAKSARVDSLEDWYYEKISAIEQRTGGRLGMALVSAEGEPILSYRTNERFAMCSTFKAPLASVLFAAHEAGTVNMFAKFDLKPSDRVPYMPFVEKKLAAKEQVSLHDLAGAAIMTSDNAAANLILNAIGGPQAFTAFVRRQGDDVTRLDRMEPELNENVPGDPRDTTSPLAMAKLMQKLGIENARQDKNKQQLQNWMKGTKTGASRIRAGMLKGWPVGNKTGTAMGGIARNDIAIIWASTAEFAAGPVSLTIYTDRPTAPPKEVDAAIAETARLIVPLVSGPG